MDEPFYIEPEDSSEDEEEEAQLNPDMVKDEYKEYLTYLEKDKICSRALTIDVEDAVEAIDEVLKEEASNGFFAVLDTLDEESQLGMVIVIGTLCQKVLNLKDTVGFMKGLD